MIDTLAADLTVESITNTAIETIKSGEHSDAVYFQTDDKLINLLIAIKASKLKNKDVLYEDITVFRAEMQQHEQRASKKPSTASSIYKVLRDYFNLTDLAKYQQYTLLSAQCAAKAGDFEEAQKSYGVLGDSFKLEDSAKCEEYKRLSAIHAIKAKNFKSARITYLSLGEYFKPTDPAKYEKYKLLAAMSAVKAGDFEAAQETYGTLGEYFKLTDPAKYEKYKLLSAQYAIKAPNLRSARQTLSILATHLAASGAPLEKVEPLLQRLTTDPLSHPYYLKHIANIYRLLGDLDTALDYAQQGVEENKDDNKSYYHLGLVLRDRRDYANALKAFEIAVELEGYKDHVHARNETQRILDTIAQWQKQSVEDFDVTATKAHEYLQDNKGEILAKLAEIEGAYPKDSINALVFRPYRQAVAALRGDTQVDDNAFSRQGFVAGQVSSPRNILDLYVNYYEDCVAENAFRSNHHGYVIGNSAKDLAAVLLKELSPVLLSHDIIKDKEFQQQEILVAERETRKANGVSWDSNPVLHAMATMAAESAVLFGWLIQQQGENAA